MEDTKLSSSHSISLSTINFDEESCIEDNCIGWTWRWHSRAGEWWKEISGQFNERIRARKDEKFYWSKAARNCHSPTQHIQSRTCKWYGNLTTCSTQTFSFIQLENQGKLKIVFSSRSLVWTECELRSEMKWKFLIFSLLRPLISFPPTDEEENFFQTKLSLHFPWRPRQTCKKTVHNFASVENSWKFFLITAHHTEPREMSINNVVLLYWKCC